jgi:hypothetical protein
VQTNLDFSSEEVLYQGHRGIRSLLEGMQHLLGWQRLGRVHWIGNCRLAVVIAGSILPGSEAHCQR